MEGFQTGFSGFFKMNSETESASASANPEES
jgi:hypothetical protein